MAKPQSPAVGQKVYDAGVWWLCTAVTPWPVWRRVSWAGPVRSAGSAPPVNASIGDWWTNPTGNIPHLYTGDLWVRMGGAPASHDGQPDMPGSLAKAAEGNFYQLHEPLTNVATGA
jgi:hypothetical protein